MFGTLSKLSLDAGDHLSQVVRLVFAIIQYDRSDDPVVG